jgi:hypothetical protein
VHLNSVRVKRFMTLLCPWSIQFVDGGCRHFRMITLFYILLAEVLIL